MDPYETMNAPGIRSAVRRSLTAPETSTPMRRMLAGRLDRRSLCRAALGAKDVQTVKRRDIGRDAAVYLALDVSSSMRDRASGAHRHLSRWELTSYAAFWMALATQQSGARLHVAHYSDIVRVALKPHQRLQTTDQASWCASGHVAGGTAGASVLYHAMTKLKPERASRKVAIIMTDGETGQNRTIPFLLKQARQAGIEVHVIGICCDPSRCWPSEICTAVAELPTLPRVLGKILAPEAQL